MFLEVYSSAAQDSCTQHYINLFCQYICFSFTGMDTIRKCVKQLTSTKAGWKCFLVVMRNSVLLAGNRLNFLNTIAFFFFI